MIEAQVQNNVRGQILFDAALVSGADARWFNPASAGDARVSTQTAGRGSVTFFDASFGPCVLRHYHRGGLAARISADRYFWTGATRTRSFREFRLLAELHALGLRVPAPVAARYVRDGLYYRADLVTRRIPGAHTLAVLLETARLDNALAVDVGVTLASFHACGVWHADLNAHNILCDAHGQVWLLDFDRGRLRVPKIGWQQANIARLRRSFMKLGAAKRVVDFDTRFWHPLLASYHRLLADRIGQREVG
ncbi:MAG: 3-deoxy-D-manno-octulosonic acid kinase [Dokdonella sp.]